MLKTAAREMLIEEVPGEQEARGEKYGNNL